MKRVGHYWVEVYGKPEAIRLDNGPELPAEAFVEWAEQNGEEVLNAHLFNSVTEVQQAAEEWVADLQRVPAPRVPG